MPTDVELTDPKLSVYVEVPHVSDDGACRVCHGATTMRSETAFWPTCWNCSRIPDSGVRTIVPISLVHTSESQLYASLRDYKSQGLPSEVRDEHALFLAATVQRFLRTHGAHVAAAAGAQWDSIQIVPSTQRRRGAHPLESVLRRTRFRDELSNFLTPTGATIGHNVPNPDAFEASRDAQGRRVLLIDNTFTTGARVQSAAVALASIGATVVAAVPIGRVIDTRNERFPEKQDFWRRQRGRVFSFDRCCLEH